ncbi:MAG: hypothetical protein J5659_00720 [Clostridia bacterium]|nr:hypothetical protein [Clostridia bacterium]
MKKIIALFVCLLTLVFVAGCKEKAEKKASHNIDIAYFADMGTFNDCPFKIGELLPDKEQLKKDEFVIYCEKEPYYASNGKFNFYYYRDDDGNLVFNKIVSFDTCLGFETGSISIEVTDVLDEQGIKYTEREPEAEELFFLPAGNNRSVVECGSLKNPLRFVFEDNALCAVLLG